jgi:hypothetical protein
MTTSPDENRPYSTAYGLGSTDTESIASSGRLMCASPSEGSVNMIGPICMPTCVGRPPLMLRPPGTSMTLARSFKAPVTPLPGASWSRSVEPIFSDWLNVSALETMAVRATTSTLAEIPAIARSTSRVTVCPATIATSATLVTKPSSDTERW